MYGNADVRLLPRPNVLSHNVSKIKIPVDPSDSDPVANLLGSSLACATPFHQKILRLQVLCHNQHAHVATSRCFTSENPRNTSCYCLHYSSYKWFPYQPASSPICPPPPKKTKSMPPYCITSPYQQLHTHLNLFIWSFH